MDGTVLLISFYIQTHAEHVLYDTYISQIEDSRFSSDNFSTHKTIVHLHKTDTVDYGSRTHTKIYISFVYS